MTAVLFSLVVFAWGLTWYAIRLQLGPVPADVSIFWRFVLADALLWAWLAAKDRARRVPLRRHRWFAALGLTFFCFNYLAIYGAEGHIPSGVVSVVFSLAAAFNALNQWVFRGIRPERRLLLGVGLGALGVGLLFADQVLSIGHAGETAVGIALAMGGTYIFSIGNLVSLRVTAEGTPLPEAVARAMAWGILFLGIFIALRGESFTPGLTAVYLGALVYLAVVGSVVGFLAYLALVARVGPPRAAYATVLSPLIALTASTFLEHYHWTVTAMVGVPLILIGNVLIFARLPRRCAVVIVAETEQ